MTESLDRSRQSQPDDSLNPIVEMRVIGFPQKEAIHAFMRQTGAELIGAHHLLSGIEDPDSPFGRRTDGVSFVFKILPTELGNPTQRVPEVTGMFAGFDMTSYYNEGYQADNANETAPAITP